jgi:hypothetical protein
MMITGVSVSALPDLRPARRLDGRALPFNGVEGHRMMSARTPLSREIVTP